MRRIRTPSSFL